MMKLSLIFLLGTLGVLLVATGVSATMCPNDVGYLETWRPDPNKCELCTCHGQDGGLIRLGICESCRPPIPPSPEWILTQDMTLDYPDCCPTYVDPNA